LRFSISTVGREQRSSSLLLPSNSDEIEGPTTHHSYVPSIALIPKQAPSVETLINLKQRYHFNCPSSSSKEGLQNGKTSDDNLFTKVDLGTTILQGLILQMQGSKTKAPENNDELNPLGSKASGLPSYCEYLRGD
jgi:hypothetical protein